MTIRISPDLADRLAEVARGDNMTVSEAIREAITAYVKRKQADPAFQVRLRARIEADLAILQRLAE
jgi:predicted transcriptional regulator